jgi:outer membrane protein OmpA-like peptidoglycan-associated protein
MHKAILGGLLGLAIAGTGCATAGAKTAGAEKIVSKRTVTWTCPAGRAPEPRNSQPNCDRQLAEAQAAAHCPLKPTMAFEKRVEFSTDSAELTASSKATLDEVASASKSTPGVYVIRIVGHTDNTGSNELNDKLSEERASAVRSHLEQEGVPEAKLESRAVGEKMPVASNESTQGRAINRSAVIIGLERH